MIWPVANTKIKKEKTKNTQKTSIFKISKNKKLRFFPMSQGTLNQKIGFLAQKMCSLARGQTENRAKIDPCLKSSIFKIFTQKFFLLFLYRNEPKYQKLDW